MQNQGVGRGPSGCPSPLPWIETSVACCGRVALRAKVLRSVEVEPPSPHPRACALSCPSLAIYLRAGEDFRVLTPARISLLKPAAGQ
jgi:hypothetical protein